MKYFIDFEFIQMLLGIKNFINILQNEITTSYIAYSGEPNLWWLFFFTENAEGDIRLHDLWKE